MADVADAKVLRDSFLLSTTLTVLPIFALVLLGWTVRKLGVFGPHATIELNRLVVYLALPALLFDIVIHARGGDVWQPGFIAAFGASSVAVFVIAVAVAAYRRRSLSDAAIEGLNAAYPNTGYMGFPLVLALFGPGALAFALIASIITVCILFGVAIVLIEISRQADRNPRRLMAKVTSSLLKNPLIVSPAIAAIVAMTYGPPPGPVDVFLKLLSGAASPCALIALGLFLAEERGASELKSNSTALWLAGAKLLLQPMIAWGIAVALDLSPAMTAAAVLLAALPTGTGPFMLAALYRCEASVTARTILITTFFAIFTIAVLLRAIV